MIGIDWGSSGFRAYLLARGGRILETREAPRGITGLTADDYRSVLQAEVGDWFAERGEDTVLLSGMVGSRQGWKEAAYADCPAGISDLIPKLCPVEMDGGREAFIIPGLACRTAEGVPDVMRGEEVQIFGALQDSEDGVFCLPGTHSKHAIVRAGRIVAFATSMTGEVFAHLRQHGLLAAMLPREADPFEPEAFSAGVDRSGAPGGLLHHLFGIRTRRLFDELGPGAALDYFSGLLIGHELRSSDWRDSGVRIIGAASLAARYQLAFRQLGIAAAIEPEHAAARGLYAIGSLLTGARR